MTNLIHFIRLFQRNLKWMFALAILTSAVVFWFTRNTPKEYQSETEIFTGITSGLSIENVDGGKTDFFASNNAFDNLINIIQSRQTLQEVGMRLLANHLMVKEPSLEVISQESFDQLNEWINAETKAKLVVPGDTEATYQNILTWYKNEFYTDAVGMVFNSSASPYSHKSIKNITVMRVQNSDLLRISYLWTDPAIAQQTLEILNHVFIRMVADIKVAQTNDIVAYFRKQVSMANDRLSVAEEKLKIFKTENRVINYGEQTKSIAMMKEYMEDEYQKEIAALASEEAAVRKLETQLSVNKEMLKYSENLLSKRQTLADINSKIAVLEVYLNDEETLSSLKNEAAKLKAEMSNDLLSRMEYSRTTEGVPVTRILEEWLDNTLALDRTKARIKVYENRKVYFNDLYDEFSVIGSTIGKIEREISIEEKNYLELLHSLNLALMRMSSETLASDGLQVTVAPFFPLSPLPSKRMLLVMLSFILTFALPFVWAVAKDLLDLSIKSGVRLAKYSGAPHIGSLPQQRLVTNLKSVDADKFTSQYLRLIWSKIENQKDENTKKPLVVNVMSLRKTEGKSYAAAKLAQELQKQGLNVYNLTTGQGGYEVNEKLNQVSKLEELTSEPLEDYDVVLVEIPALVDEPYSKNLLKTSHVNIVVTWAGRIWGDADNRKLSELQDQQNAPLQMLLNGADLDEMETMLGELPKKRSALRTYLKRFVQLQFKSSVASA